MGVLVGLRGWVEDKKILLGGAGREMQGWTSEAGNDWEDARITMSLEDFLGIDENNLAVTLLFLKSAQLRCSCSQAEVVGSKIIAELD